MGLSTSRARRPKIFDSSVRFGALADLTGFHLRRASLFDFSTFSDTTGDPAITPLRYSVLEVISANPALKQIELGAILGLSKPAATIAVDFWQERGCVQRRRQEEDGRARRLHLTATGETVLLGLRRAIAMHDAALTSSLDEEELATLHRLLHKIIAGAESRDHGGPTI